MNPSPNPSSKSSKSTSTRKAQPSELAVNPPKDTDSIPETPDESSVPSPLAAPVDQNQPPTPTDAPASKDRLQRPRYSSALDKDKTKPQDQPSNSPAPSEQPAPSEAVSDTPALAVAPPANAEPPANESQATEDISSVMRQHPIPPPANPDSTELLVWCGAATRNQKSNSPGVY
ncbi:hypothetical protein [Microcoleus vaginatus]|uniref:hypothetical protein n=1 Tax=Microcoleus vaginatus TaxID=119532 RepID=UPI001F61A2F5